MDRDDIDEEIKKIIDYQSGDQSQSSNDIIKDCEAEMQDAMQEAFFREQELTNFNSSTPEPLEPADEYHPRDEYND